MPNLEDVKKALEAIKDGGGELYEAVLTAVQTEKDKGISEASKLRREAQTKGGKVKLLSESLKVLGYDTDDDDADLDSFLVGVKEQMEAGKGSKKNKGKATELETENIQMRKDHDALQKKFDASEAEKAATNQKLRTQKITAGLEKAFQNEDGVSTIYGAGAEIRCLIADGKVDLSGDGDTIVFKDGEDIVALQDGVTKFKESRPESVKNIQRAGPGTPPGGPTADRSKESDADRLSRLRTQSSGPNIRMA